MDEEAKSQLQMKQQEFSRPESSNVSGFIRQRENGQIRGDKEEGETKKRKLDVL